MAAETMIPIPLPWAKTNRRSLDDPSFAWLSLACHSVDVAVTLGELLSGETLNGLETAAGRDLTLTDVHRLGLLALYHDAGKACPGFQNKIVRPQRDRYTGHTGQLLALAERIRRQQPVTLAGEGVIEALQLEELDAWFEEGVLDAVTLVASHHGGVVADLPTGDPLLGAEAATIFDHNPIAAMAALAKLGRQLFPAAWNDIGKLPTQPAFWHAFLGLLMLADWIASDARYFPLTGADEEQSRAKRAKLSADALLASIGFHEPLPRDHPHPIPFLLRGYPPRPLQAAVAEVPIDEQLVVIEAPTGEGKTEAALIRYLGLLRAGEVDGLYFALPTRAAGKQIHMRVQEAFRRIWPQASLPPVILAQGGDRDDRDQHDEYQDRPWASEDTRRFLAAGIAVGTVDQALLSVLRVRYAHLRGAALMRSLLVIDEVHASNPYMAELTAELVRRHLQLGGHVVCLSATLGSAGLGRLTGEQRSAGIAGAKERPYPLITTQASSIEIPYDARRERTVATSIIGQDEALVRTTSAVTGGARVLWLRSAVDDAIADHRALLAAGVTTLTVAGKPVPHHGRFASADRPLLDAAILSVLSPGRNRSGLVVVATQTAEQSLDIDADLMITDACPPDVLLQRLGRLHRHDLPRPEGYVQPCLHLIKPGPLQRYLRREKELPQGQPGQRWPWVYPNLLSVCETLRWVSKGMLKLPHDCRAMVEDGTHLDHLHDLAKQLGGDWPALWATLYGRDGALRTEARQVLLDWSKPALVQPILAEQAVRSRIGADKVSLPAGFETPLGGKVDRLELPFHWVASAVPERIEVVGEEEGVIALRAGSLALRYSTVGLEKVG